MCDIALIAGELWLKSAFGMSQSFFSWQHLWWNRTGAKREMVIQSGGVTGAGRCPECGLIAFVPPAPRRR
jgi:hypothetical protein